jgi:hypothetical protein
VAETHPPEIPEQLPPVGLDEFFDLLRDRLAPPAELLTRETFAALLDVGVSTFDRLRETGAIGPRPIKLADRERHQRGDAV